MIFFGKNMETLLLCSYTGAMCVRYADMTHMRDVYNPCVVRRRRARASDVFRV